MAEVTNFSLLVISAAMMISVAIATDNPQHYQQDQIGCNQIYTDANATTFWQSRDNVLESLSKVSLNRYNVYGVAVCRKYLTSGKCSDCVREAAKGIKAACLKDCGGRIHLEGCFLQYENYSNILLYENYTSDVGAIHYCFSTNDCDPQAVSQRVTVLSRQLIENASANNGYATGSIDGSVYGLAQCWPTLTNSSCQKCLSGARNLLLGCLPQQEGRGLEAGCFMRYSTYSFFTANQTSTSMNLTPCSGKLLKCNFNRSISQTATTALFCKTVRTLPRTTFADQWFFFRRLRSVRPVDAWPLYLSKTAYLPAGKARVNWASDIRPIARMDDDR